MKKIFPLLFIGVGLVGCGHQASTKMGELMYDDYFKMCVGSNVMMEWFTSYRDIGEYCGCRAYYISQNVTLAEYRDMINAEFDTGRSYVSARILNQAELYCRQ